MKIRVHYGSEDILCDVHENPSVKSKIRIHVYPGGGVEIEAPPEQTADEIRVAAQKRARWIFNHVRTSVENAAIAQPREYVSGETHFYLGRRYKLIVTAAPAQLSSVKLTRGRLDVRAPVYDPAVVKRRLDKWYKSRAEEYFARKLAEVARTLPWITANPEFKLVKMSTQWGSCAPNGLVHLNPALIKAPRHCVEYVLIHELCHIQEHNHSKRFYTLLDRHIPQWRATKAELDALSELLLAD